MGYDRGDVLARIPLASLCDELLGPHHGRGRTASWSCPDPGHGPQTGRTPPVTVFRPRSGIERWHCHACGAGGTAIDLVMLTHGVGFRDAMDLLAHRAGVTHEPGRTPPAPRPSPPVGPEPPRPTEPDPALDRYVTGCEAWLWSPAGAPMRRWLAGRRLAPEVLQANRVGADPGPRALPRAPGLPRAGPAVVFPLLGENGQAVYLQARYLRPNGRKYDNPSADLVPASPRLGEVLLASPARTQDLMLICEGIPDALTAAQAGYRAVAILGAGLPDARLATQLAARHPEGRLLVAFDADHRGRAGSARLTELLAEVGADNRVATLAVPPAFGDLNGWAQAARDSFPEELAAAISQTAPTAALTAVEVRNHHGKETAVSLDHARDELVSQTREELLSNQVAPDLDDLLETLAYQHLLLDDQPVVAQNLQEVVAALETWRSGAAPLGLDGDGRLTEKLERIGYHHLLGDNHADVQQALGQVARAVDHWTDVAANPTPEVPREVGAAKDAFGWPGSLLPEPPTASLDGPDLGW